VSTPPIDLDNFARRLIQDALSEATAFYWSRRAEAFEWARPRDDDFSGSVTREELDARADRIASLALACRRAASLAVFQNSALLDDLLAEAA